MSADKTVIVSGHEELHRLLEDYDLNDVYNLNETAPLPVVLCSSSVWSVFTGVNWFSVDVFVLSILSVCPSQMTTQVCVFGGLCPFLSTGVVAALLSRAPRRVTSIHIGPPRGEIYSPRIIWIYHMFFTMGRTHSHL